MTLCLGGVLSCDIMSWRRFVLWHFVLAAFCPVTFCLSGILSWRRFVLWHFVLAAFCPVTFYLWGILSSDVMSVTFCPGAFCPGAFWPHARQAPHAERANTVTCLHLLITNININIRKWNHFFKTSVIETLTFHRLFHRLAFIQTRFQFRRQNILNLCIDSTDELRRWNELKSSSSDVFFPCLYGRRE